MATKKYYRLDGTIEDTDQVKSDESLSSINKRMQQPPAMAAVAQTVKPAIQTFDNNIRTFNQNQMQNQPVQTQTTNPLVTIGKTAGNIATNMGEGALRTGEAIVDTSSSLADRATNALSYWAIRAIYGKKKADKFKKESDKATSDFVKRDLTKEFQDKTGFSDIKEDWEKGSLVKSGNFGGQVAQGIGGMVPSLVAGQYAGFTPNMTSTQGLSGLAKAKAIGGNIAKTYVSQLPANAILGASSYGSGMEEALRGGANLSQASRYGLANAAIEQGTEMLTGGIPGLGGQGGIDNLVNPLIDRNTRGYANALLKAGYGALGEGLEESAGTYLGALAKKGILNKDIDWNEVNQEALQSGLVGAATGAVLNAPSTVQDIRNARVENQEIKAEKQRQQEAKPVETEQTVEQKPVEEKPVQQEQNKTLPHSTKVSEVGYHASDKKFDKFDTSKIGTGQGDNTQGKGVNLASVREAVEGVYGKNTYETNINLENAYTVDDKKLLSTFEKDFGYKTDMDNISDELQKKGYDGIVINVNGNKLYTVFDSKNLEIVNGKKEPSIKAEEFKQAQQKVKNGTATEKERSYIKTATEAQNTEEITKQMDEVSRTYEVLANEKTLKQAEAKISGIESLDDQAKYVNNILKSDKRLNASDMAAAELVLKNAAAAKNTSVYNDVLANLSIYATEQGQSIQALSLIKKLSPTNQLDVLERVIKREQAKGNKAYEGLKITDDMKNKIFDCYDENGKVNQEKFDNTMEEIKQELANNMKADAGEKVRAWRYLSMLGNPKTHVRNEIANVAMSIVKLAKDTVSATGQDIFVSDKANKTRTLKTASKEVKNLASTTYEQAKEGTVGNKYNEKNDLEDRKQVFKNNWLEKVRKLNDRLLTKEDQYFKKLNYKKAFSNYLTAQGISTETDIQNNPQIIERAKQFAINEANIATFNQPNKLAEFINSADTKLGTPGKVIRGAIIPFTRTPLNIAKTGIEYTPGVGLATTIADVKKAPKNMKGSVLIDGLSKQITGSSLALLGYALAKSGIVTAGAGDDKDDYFEINQGSKMDYSIKLGDTSYDLSWLSPSSMPFFVGARMFEVLDKQEGINENIILESLASTLDPLSEMSCISSFTDILQSYNQDSTGMIKDMGVSTMQNYLSQFIPTVSGQFARLFDDTKRTTMADKNAPNKISQETYRTLAYKIPGLRNTLPESTDYLGREKKEEENKGIRAFDAFLNPANKKKDEMTKEGKEVVRLYQKTGNGDVIPSALAQNIKYNDNNYEMSRKEYNKYKKDFGDTYSDNVKELMKTDAYKDADDNDKAKMIAGVMKYSKDKAKDVFLTDKGEEYSSTSDEIDDFAGDKMSISDYYALKVSSTTKVGDGTTSIVNGQNAYKNIALVDAFDMDAKDYLKYSYEIGKIKADKDANGKSISGTAKRKKMEYIQSLPLSATQKEMLYSLKVDGSSKKKTSQQVIQTIENADLSAEEKKELYKYIYN